MAAPPPPGQQQQQQPSTHSPSIAIPSAKDVRAAERKRAAVPNLFAERQRQQAAVAATASVPKADPLAFVGSAGGSAGSRPPAQQQKHWQQQQRPTPLAHLSQPQQQQQVCPPPPSHGSQPSGQPPRQPLPPGPQQQQYHARLPGPPHQPPPHLPPQQQAFLPNAIIVNRRQEGNPVLKHIRNASGVACLPAAQTCA